MKSDKHVWIKCPNCPENVLTNRLLQHLMKNHFVETFTRLDKKTMNTRWSKASDEEPFQLDPTANDMIYCCFGCNVSSSKRGMAIRNHFNPDDPERNHGEAHLKACKAIQERLADPSSYIPPTRKPRTVKEKPEPSPVGDSAVAAAPEPKVKVVEKIVEKVVEKVIYKDKIVEKVVYRDSSTDHDAILDMMAKRDKEAFRLLKENELLKAEIGVLKKSLKTSLKEQAKKTIVCDNFRILAERPCTKECARTFTDDDEYAWVQRIERKVDNQDYDNAMDGLRQFINRKQDDINAELENPYNTIQANRDTLIDMGFPEDEVDMYDH